MNLAKRISCFGLIFLLGGMALRAENLSVATTNAVADTNFTVTAPAEAAGAVSNAVAPTTNPAAAVFAAPVTNGIVAATPAMSLSPAVPVHDNLIWLGMAGVSALSLAAIIISWQVSRRQPASAPVSAQSENLPVPVAQFLPLISLTVKETLAHELAAQRRELLSAQQAATMELAQLARRLEAIQTPLLERPVAPRNGTAKGLREIPIKLFCECGQKYSFEVRPVDGRMPFPVACPACGQDGTGQANHFLAKMLNGVTQPLPSPSLALPPAQPPATPPPLVETTKSATNGHEPANGTTASPHHTDICIANLLAEGSHLLEAGKYDSALKCFDTALALHPDRADTLVKLGSALDRLGRTDEALKSFDRAIELDDSLATAYLNKGGIFNRLARYDEALQCYEQALTKQKKSAA